MPSLETSDVGVTDKGSSDRSSHEPGQLINWALEESERRFHLELDAHKMEIPRWLTGSGGF